MTSLENSSIAMQQIDECVAPLAVTEEEREIVDCFKQSILDLNLAVCLKNLDAAMMAYTTMMSLSKRVISNKRLSGLLSEFDVIQSATVIDLMVRTFAKK